MHARDDASGTDDPGPSGEGRFASPAETPPSEPPAPMVLRTSVFDAADLRRALTRIAHEIVERNHGAGNVVLVGMYTRGVALSQRLAAAIASFEGVEVPLGALDVSFYRDDIGLLSVNDPATTE